MSKYILSFLLSLTFFITGIFTLSDYGINWDAPLAMIRGQAYAQLLLLGKPALNDLPRIPPNLIAHREYVSRYYFAAAETWEDGNVSKAVLPISPLPQVEFENANKMLNRNISFYQYEKRGGEYFKKNDSGGHLPLVSILSAFSNKLLWQSLGWFGDIESYQLINLIIASMGVFIVCVFAMEITGSVFAGLIAGLFLALSPQFFAESHINMKDPIQASFFAGAIWAFWHWAKGDKLGRLGWFGVFIAFTALALAVKWNVIFLPLILLPWLILIRFKGWRRLGRAVVLGGLGIILFLIITWPYAWSNPLSALIDTANYYFQTGTGKTLIQPQGHEILGFNLYPIKLLLFQTPEITLFFLVISLFWMSSRRDDSLKLGYLLFLWFLIPIIRLTIPGAWSYGGTRQIMEVLPAMAVLAGIGVWYLVRKVGDVGVVRGKIKVILVITVITIILLLPIWQLHPNQNAYFNILAGGLAGAKEKNLIDWAITYGNIYKQGALWINKDAEMNSNITHLSGADFALSPLYLREDISISPYHFSGFRQSGEYIMALYNPLDPPVFAQRYPQKFLNPVHQIVVDGVPLLSIYKNDPQYLKTDFAKEGVLKAVQMIPQTTPEADFWKIDLGREYQVTRIIVSGVNSECIGGFEPNEAVAFIPESQALRPVDLTKAYVLNDKGDLGEGKVEYLFAAESARFIYIYPQNDSSCFAQERILSVNYLDN